MTSNNYIIFNTNNIIVFNYHLYSSCCQNVDSLYIFLKLHHILFSDTLLLIYISTNILRHLLILIIVLSSLSEHLFLLYGSTIFSLVTLTIFFKSLIYIHHQNHFDIWLSILTLKHLPSFSSHYFIYIIKTILIYDFLYRHSITYYFLKVTILSTSTKP